ncbi:MAG: hypothetical protein WBB28_18080 [Crinalium sp.]
MSINIEAVIGAIAGGDINKPPKARIEIKAKISPVYEVQECEHLAGNRFLASQIFVKSPEITNSSLTRS